MTVEGPNGTTMYSPLEAYDLTGAHLYQGKWNREFLFAPVLPDAVTAQKQLEAGTIDSTDLGGHADPTTDEYKAAQIKIVRTLRVLRELFQTLEFGKAQAWAIASNGSQPIPFEDWAEGGEARRKVIEVLETYFHRGVKKPDEILIEKLAFDRWIDMLPVPQTEPAQPLGIKRQPGRPKANWDAIRREIDRREKDGEFPDLEGAWRSSFCKELCDWYAMTHPDEQQVKPETVMKKLKTELDRLSKAYS